MQLQLRLECAETRHVYPPANACIYCGADGGKQGRSIEHILAKGLGGKLEFPNASCSECAKLTGAMEQKLLRGPLWPVRVRTGIHSGRRKKQQPKDFDVEYWQEEKRLLYSTPVQETTVNLVLPGLPPPGMLNEGSTTKR